MNTQASDCQSSDAHAKWAEWSPRPAKKPVKLTNVVSVIVLATAAVQLVGLPMV